jgi:spore maturation protein CgeB
VKILCVMGKHQYGDPVRGMATEYAAFLPALRRLGHEVVHFESWDRDRFRDFAELNRALLDTVERERPDVMLSVPLLYEIWLETLGIIKARGDVATVCWCTDDSWKYREFSKIVGHAYHAMTTTCEQVLPDYRRDGITNVLLTQWAANAETLREPLPASACPYQVSFVGAAHGDRRKSISALQAAGIEVSCFGHGWPAGSVSAGEIPKIMRESVISLNFANSKGQNQIKARTFEVPGAGGFLLTEDAPRLSAFYTPGEEIETFGNRDELADKIKYFLSHPEDRNRIARAGYERTKLQHTYDARMKEVVNFSLRALGEAAAQQERTVPYSFAEARGRHSTGFLLKAVRAALVLPCVMIWGKRRGYRAARRLLFEISWRIFPRATYSAAGWPGRLFYRES